MEKLYFDIIDSITGLKISKLKFIILFLFFPLIIILSLTTVPIDVFKYLLVQSNVLFYMSLSIVFAFAPALMKPSWHFLRNENYFVYRKFIKILNSSNITYSDISFLYDNKNNLVDYRSYKWLKIFCIDLRYIPTKEFSRDINKSTNPLLGKNKFSQRTKKKLHKFLSENATKYFEQADYDIKYFEELFFKNESINYDSKIKLFEKIQSIDIYDLIKLLKEATGIHMNKLSVFFLKYSNENKTYVDLNWSSIKSSKSQIDNYCKS